MRHVNEGLLSTLSQGQAAGRMSAGWHGYTTDRMSQTAHGMHLSSAPDATTMTYARPFPNKGAETRTQ